MYIDFDGFVKILILAIPIILILWVTLKYFRSKYKDIKNDKVEYNYKVSFSSLKLAIIFSSILLFLSIILDINFFIRLNDINVAENIKLCTLIGLSPLLPGGFLLSYVRKMCEVKKYYKKTREELE